MTAIRSAPHDSAASLCWPAALFATGLLVYAVFLGRHVGAYAAGSDSSGYLNSARLLSHGRLTAEQRSWPGLPAGPFDPYTFVPLGFKPAPRGEMAPTYPIGLPLLIMTMARAVGWDAAPHAVIVMHALAGVLLMGWLGLCAGLSSALAALGALLLATCPLYVYSSLQLMSDVPATAWAIATVAFAWNARRRGCWAVAAGASLGMAVLIRPTNVLLALPAAVALGGDRRRWLAFVAGAAPFAAAQIIYNKLAYGHPFASGYGAIGEEFRWRHVPLSLENYGRWLPILLTPLGLAALLLPICARTKPLWTALLAIWMAAFASLYAFYSHTHEAWWYLRFVLPAFPAAWIAALLAASGLRRRWGPRLLAPGSAGSWLTGGLVSAAALLFALHWNGRLETERIGDGERTYLRAIEWMRPQVPASAVVIARQASGALFYYTDLPILRWDQIEPGGFDRVERAAAGRPVFALLMPFEERQAFAERRLSGPWTLIGGVDNFHLWRLESGSASSPAAGHPG